MSDMNWNAYEVPGDDDDPEDYDDIPAYRELSDAEEAAEEATWD